MHTVTGTQACGGPASGPVSFCNIFAASVTGSTSAASPLPASSALASVEAADSEARAAAGLSDTGAVVTTAAGAGAGAVSVNVVIVGSAVVCMFLHVVLVAELLF